MPENIEIGKYLIEKGANLNDRKAYGSTPLALGLFLYLNLRLK